MTRRALTPASPFSQNPPSRINRIKNGCWEWQAAKDESGYARMGIAGKTWRVHRLMWTIFYGSIPRGGQRFICHTCDNPKCVNPDHLRLGNNKDNVTDCFLKGRGARGEKFPQAKLTENNVMEIRRRSANGETLDALAAAFGVSQTTISYVKNGIKWKYLCPTAEK